MGGIIGGIVDVVGGYFAGAGAADVAAGAVAGDVAAGGVGDAMITGALAGDALGAGTIVGTGDALAGTAIGGALADAGIGGGLSLGSNGLLDLSAAGSGLADSSFLGTAGTGSLGQIGAGGMADTVSAAGGLDTALGTSLEGMGYTLPAGTTGVTSAAANAAIAAGGGPWGTLAQNALSNAGKLASGIGSVAQGVNGLGNQNQLAQAGANADPLQPYRAGFAAKLNDLMNNPSLATSMPGYQAGLQAVQRAGAAQGFQGSGNMMQALSQYGDTFFNQDVTQLAGLAGGTAGAGGQYTVGGIQLGNNSIGAIGSGLGAIASGITSMGT